ncbi:glyoxalase superfamily protein [Pseudomonas sp. JH-2]|uniref:glyoxalase superfamily protein n=1 Tax=Pseudomonas sp. JH-2 TaxID=3114998 RepID=UPI002E260B58|nr:glyoxalase superfamily protein [Pseudomonas sp. JH-2]
MPQQQTRPSLERLKKQAKAIKKATGCSHCQALEELAKVHGFRTWAALTAKHKEQHRVA